MADHYDIGDRVRLRAIFTDVDTGVETDPTTVICKVKTPDKVTTTYTYGAGGDPIVKEGVGRYRLVLDIDQEKWWYFKWFGTGALVAAEPGSIFVQAEKV